MTKENILKEMENIKIERNRFLKSKHASPQDMIKLLSVYDKKLEKLNEELSKFSKD